MSAIPEGEKESRFNSFDKENIVYPAVKWGMHLIGYMDDLNTVSWPNLKAYMSLTGVEIPPGECRLIIKLSMEQQKMLEQAKQLSCPAPYQPDDEAAHDRSERIVGSFTDRFKSK